MEKLSHASQRLYWRLTSSYIAVTIGALLVSILVLGPALFLQIFLPNNMMSPNDWYEIVKEDSDGLAAALLTQDPIDTHLINVLLQGLDATITSRSIVSIGAFEVQARTIGEFNVILLGPENELLGAHDRSLFSGITLGDPIDTQVIPGLDDLLRKSKIEEYADQPLYSVITPNKEYVLVVPISMIAGGEYKYLGAEVVYIERLPTRDDIPIHALMLAARGLLLFIVGAGLLGAFFGALTANGFTRRFEHFSSAAESWSEGDLSIRIEDETGDEISDLAGQLNQMAVQLQTLMEERQKMAILEERHRLARELHDSTKQQALAASFQLGAAITLAEKDPAGSKQHMLEADRLVDSVRVELTDLIHELRPTSMEGRDLSDALETYAIEWAHQNEITLDLELAPDRNLDLETRQTLYRVAQEGLANVARHSGATNVRLKLSYDNHQVNLCIEDDGCGFDVNGDYPGIGLETMEERCIALNGSLTIISGCSEGTKICAFLPARLEEV